MQNHKTTTRKVQSIYRPSQSKLTGRGGKFYPSLHLAGKWLTKYMKIGDQITITQEKDCIKIYTNTN